MALDCDRLVVNGNLWNQLGMQPDLLLGKRQKRRLPVSDMLNATFINQFGNGHLAWFFQFYSVSHVMNEIKACAYLAVGVKETGSAVRPLNPRFSRQVMGPGFTCRFSSRFKIAVKAI